MAFEESEPKEISKQNFEKNQVQARCEELELEIAGTEERLLDLNKKYDNIVRLESLVNSVKEIVGQLEARKDKLLKWPKGLFGLKNKTGYDDLLREISKLENGLKKKEQERAELIEENLSSAQIKDEIDLLNNRMAEIKFERRKTGLKLFAKEGDRSLEEALEMFGDNFFGPEEVARVFGFQLKPEDIPPLPDKEKLEKARQFPEHLKMILALRFEAGQMLEWRMFPRTIVSETQWKDYVGETRGIRDFLVLNGLIAPEELEECTDEELNQISELMKTDETAATRRLLGLKINQNRRHTEKEIQYFVRLFRGEADDLEFTKKLDGRRSNQETLDDAFESTKTFSEDQRGVWVKRIGKFTENRAGGYAIETVKPTLGETEGWGTSYNTGVRVIL